MLKAFFIALCATAMALAAPDESSSRVGAALGSPWSVLSISAVVTDSCMGPQHVGFHLKREKDRITIATMKTELGEIVLGPMRELSKSQLDNVLRMTALHYDAALASKSTREALHERVNLLATEDRLKEIARVSRTTDLTSLGISISFGDRLTDQRFENDFDKPTGTAFANWVANPIDPKTSSK
jgi:hypothetical protein